MPSSFKPKHRFIFVAFPALLCTFLLTISKGCTSSKMESPRVTLLRVGGLIDGSVSRVKTPSWVKIVDGVITQIAPDSLAHQHFHAESENPEVLFVQAPQMVLVPGLVGVFMNTEVSPEKPFSEKELNNVLKRGITTLVLVDPKPQRSLAIQKYSLDAKRRTPRISIGTKIRLTDPKEVSSAIRTASKFPIELVWFSPQTNTTSDEICEAAKEAAFHELSFVIHSRDIFNCSNTSIRTVRPCVEAQNSYEHCLFDGSRKIGNMTESRKEGAKRPLGESNQITLDANLESLSWGAAHLIGYQDAIGKIEVGYRGDLLLVQPMQGNSKNSVGSINTILIDGTPQDIGEPSFSARFWFWKTVDLGL